MHFEFRRRRRFERGRAVRCPDIVNLRPARERFVTEQATSVPEFGIGAGRPVSGVRAGGDVRRCDSISPGPLKEEYFLERLQCLATKWFRKYELNVNTLGSVRTALKT